MCKGKVNSMVTQVNDFKLSPYYKVLLCLAVWTQIWPPLSSNYLKTNCVILDQQTRNRAWYLLHENVDDIQVLVMSVFLGVSSHPVKVLPLDLVQLIQNTADCLQPPQIFLYHLPPSTVCSCSYHIQSPMLAYQPLKASTPVYFQTCGSSPTRYATTSSLLCIKVQEARSLLQKAKSSLVHSCSFLPAPKWLQRSSLNSRVTPFLRL